MKTKLLWAMVLLLHGEMLFLLLTKPSWSFRRTRKVINLPRCNKKFGHGALVIVADQGAQRSYAPAIRSMQCYGQKHNYSVFVLDPATASGECALFQDIMFKRHCIVLKVLQSYNWVAAFDGDVGVVDAERCIESLMRTDVDIVHEERFHNGEVQAGNYIVRNTSFSRKYLQEWMALEAESRQGAGYQNSDNGALHSHLFRHVTLRDASNQNNCHQLWKDAHNLDTYDAFVGCVMQYASAFPKNIRLLRRGHGFVRDLWVTENEHVSPVDFFVHALKDKVQFYDENTQHDGCGTAAYAPKLLPGKMLSVRQMKRIIAKADRTAMNTRPRSISENATISYCWPECDEYIQK